MPGFFILLSPHLRPGSLVNRASDSGSEGRGFESHPGHKKSLVIVGFPRIFCLCDFKENYNRMCKIGYSLPSPSKSDLLYVLKPICL